MQRKKPFSPVNVPISTGTGEKNSAPPAPCLSQLKLSSRTNLSSLLYLKLITGLPKAIP